MPRLVIAGLSVVSLVLACGGEDSGNDFEETSGEAAAPGGTAGGAGTASTGGTGAQTGGSEGEAFLMEYAQSVCAMYEPCCDAEGLGFDGVGEMAEAVELVRLRLEKGELAEASPLVEGLVIAEVDAQRVAVDRVGTVRVTPPSPMRFWPCGAADAQRVAARVGRLSYFDSAKFGFASLMISSHARRSFGVAPAYSCKLFGGALSTARRRREGALENIMHLRSSKMPPSAERRFVALLLLSTLGFGVGALGCSDETPSEASSGGGGGTGATAASGGGDAAGSSSGGSSTGGSASGGSSAGSRSYDFNQCGVAAPVPENAGQCAVVSVATITDFDDFAGDDAAGYTYYVNGEPAADGAVLGGIQHVGDGSDSEGGTSVIATEMVEGAGDAGYALQFSNTNATNWGGLLMFYFPGDTNCLDATSYTGVEFSIKGSSPSGKFGVSLNQLDTMPSADGGLCDSSEEKDCENATLQLALPDDAETWTKVRVPWSALTPGVGEGLTCIPVTGQNLARLVIQPFMNYAPPDFEFEPGPYSIAVDDLGFYVDPASGQASLTGFGSDPSCELGPSLEWSASQELISPVSDDAHDILAVKDPTVVEVDGRFHVFASTVSSAGAYSMMYTSFTDFGEAASAPVYYMDQTPGFEGYTAAPQIFFFTPLDKWFLVFQSGPPMYSTADDLADPSTFTRPAPFFSSTPAIITQNGGGWLDYWVICDASSCHLFFSDNHGRWYQSKTSIEDFPNGFGEPVVVLEDANSGRVFEASNVYKINGTNQYLALIEAFDRTSGDHRYFRSWLADSLDGPWLPWQASGSYPFAGATNVTFDGAAWTEDISHGDMVRAGYDETLAIDPCHLRFVFQGADPAAETGGDYNKIPWRIGLLTQTE